MLRACFAADRELTGRGARRRLLVVGKKGIGTLRFRGWTIDQSWSGKSDRPTYADAEAIAHHVIDLYTSEKVDRVRLIYNHFKTPIEQTLMDVQVLPIQPQEIYTEGRERPLVVVPLRTRRGRHLRLAAAALRRDRHLPGAARIERERAGRPHERHAQRQ